MRRSILCCIALILGLLASACGDAGGQDIRFSVVLEGDSAARYSEAGGLVIASAEEWQVLQAQLQRDIDLRPALPSVDFSQTVLAAVFAGAKPRGGYTIKVRRIVQTERDVIVYVTEQAPSSGQAGTAQITYPYQIVSLPRTSLPLRFSFDTRSS